MTYTEAMEKINSLLIFGIKPGLQRIRELIERIGSPDQQLKFVHIAGTNGKGSVSALTANTLKCAGYKTGLFISPYITDFRERFQINGEMISEDELVQAVEKIYPIAEAMKQEQKIITEFEFIFAVALYWYAQQKCDVVVLVFFVGLSVGASIGTFKPSGRQPHRNIESDIKRITKNFKIFTLYKPPQLFFHVNILQNHKYRSISNHVSNLCQNKNQLDNFYSNDKVLFFLYLFHIL